MNLERLFPWTVFACAVVYLLVVMVPPVEPPGEMRIHQFGELPVLDGDRVKPMDTFARVNLMLISGKQTFTDEDGKSQPAVKWVLDVMASGLVEETPPPAYKHKVFRIQNEELLALLGLEVRPGLRYSLEEFKDKMDVLEREVERARNVEESKRTKLDAKTLQLVQGIQTFILLSRFQVPAMVPPRSAGEEAEWKSMAAALDDHRQGAALSPAADSLREVLAGYILNKSDVFNTKLDAYQKQFTSRLSGEAGRAEFEYFFNQFNPFWQCALLYGCVFLLAVCAWIGWRQPLAQSAFLLGLVLLAVQTFGLLARMYIQGRPPVTNLYSSAVFIGWGSVALCLAIEYVFRNGVGTLVASILGGLTMIIAMHLAESGDTMEKLVAVLDTNFWLATHVTCVTLGYTATFVAGMAGTAFILLGVCTRQLDPTLRKTLAQITYGVVCFATLLSFTGTVLGGIWADQSWGRFWGWDPKENGALLIVIANALILHARWGGMIKDRGIAVLAVAGNMITAWSWFGTNQLSVGLHNYGFNNTLALGCRYYWLSQLGIIGLGLMPPRFWRSYRPHPSAAGQPEAQS